MTEKPDLLSPSGRAALRAAGPECESDFLARVRRWGPDLTRGLSVYDRPGSPANGFLLRQVLDLVLDAALRRRPTLANRDRDRLLHPDWFAEPDMIEYVVDVDRFAGSLTGVRQRIGYLRELGVTSLHLLPFLATRDGEDAGDVITDHRKIRPALGTVRDLVDLADALHVAGLSLTLGLTLNHVAREHPWARAARDGDVRFRRFFHTFPDRAVPDAYERVLPELRPGTAPGNFTWEPDLTGAPDAPGRPGPVGGTGPGTGPETGRGYGRGQPGAWVWTTFHPAHWDLNWANPEVFTELLDVILSLANVGADALRLDTVDFLWKEPDTTCRNRPQAQLILQALRAALRIAAPGVALDVGATGMTEDLPAPFGTGIHAGRVGDLSPHPGLMVHLWSALATGDATLARQALTMPAPKPVTTAWVTYARDHDDIDWAISDQDAARAGLSGDAHRDYLADFYAGRSPRSFARGSDVRTGPAPGERRTSGSLASLAGVESAKAPGADPADLDRALGRVFLLHAVLYGYGGIPRLTMGDELGLCSNHNGGTPDAGEDTDADTATSADTDTTGNAPGRHRLALPWDVAERRHDPDSTEGRIFSGLAHLARVRTGLPGLHASVEAVPVDVGNRAVLGLLRRHPAGELIQLYNVSGTWQRVPFEVLDRARPPAGTPRSDLQRWEFISAFEPTPAPGDGDGTGDGNGNGDDAPALALPPYAAWWVGFRPAP